MDTGQRPTSRGQGEFAGKAYRRAWTDYKRGQKAARALREIIPGTLKAELINAAEFQRPRKANGFDYWVMINGTIPNHSGKGVLYIPARGHRALNRALAQPGAQLSIGSKSSAEVFRKNGKWYCRVTVKIPLSKEQSVNEWIGCDVGIRRAVTCSDGYQSCDLRPLIKRQRDRRALDQKQGRDRSYEMSPQRQAQAKDARALVSRAHKSGRGLGLENPDRLPRWKQWSARFFAKRVLLLAAVAGVPVRLVVRPILASPVLVADLGTRSDTRRCFGASGAGSRRMRTRTPAVTFVIRSLVYLASLIKVYLVFLLWGGVMSSELQAMRFQVESAL